MENFKPYLWIDIETTGLSDDNLHILEIGLVVTNKKCDIIESHKILISHPNDVYDNMTDWAKNVHKELVEECKHNGVTINEASEYLLHLFKRLTGIYDDDELQNCKKLITLAGSSVWNDRKILLNTFPQLKKYLYHQLLDITSILLAAKMLNFHALKDKPENTSTHRALDDIMSSMKLFMYLGEKFFKDNKISL